MSIEEIYGHYQMPNDKQKIQYIRLYIQNKHIQDLKNKKQKWIKNVNNILIILLNAR